MVDHRYGNHALARRPELGGSSIACGRFLREHQPKTLIFWGQRDLFFTPEGGEAYLRDLPEAEIHRLSSGHFAVEDCLEEIADGIRRFYDEKVASAPRAPAKAG